MNQADWYTKIAVRFISCKGWDWCLLDGKTVWVNPGWFAFSVDNGEGGTFIRSELETKYRGMEGGDVKGGLEGFFGTCDQDQVIGIGQAGQQGFIVVECLTSRKGGCLDLDGAYNYFNAEVKQDCAEGATLFDAGQDGDRVSGFGGCSDGCGGSSIRVSD